MTQHLESLFFKAAPILLVGLWIAAIYFDEKPEKIKKFESRYLKKNCHLYASLMFRYQIQTAQRAVLNSENSPCGPLGVQYQRLGYRREVLYAM